MNWSIPTNVWNRIIEFQGKEFKTITGKPFYYAVKNGNTILVEREGDVINQSISKRNFEHVFTMNKTKPIDSPSKINIRAVENNESQVRGHSYVWAILNDERIIL